MDLQILRPGHRVKTRSGREAEVLAEPSGGTVRVAYLDRGPHGTTARTGEESTLAGDEVEALLGAVPPGSWQQRVTVVLHHFPETMDSPAEYRAETLSGVPNDVVVSGGGSSARAALDHLLGGLYLTGFRGMVLVEDGANENFQRYSVEVKGNGSSVQE